MRQEVEPKTRLWGSTIYTCQRKKSEGIRMTQTKHAATTPRIALGARSGMHAFLMSGTPVRALYERGHAEDSYPLLNALFMSKDVESLAAAAGALGPMFPGDSRFQATADEVSGLIANGSLAVPVADRLLEECYFDPYARPGSSPALFESFGRVPRAATRRAANGMSIQAPGLDELLGTAGSFSIEPIHDWTLLRNLMSVAMRILSTSSTSGGESVLTDSGFLPTSPQSSECKAAEGTEAYAIPIAYNPFFSRPTIDLTWDDNVVWPFYDSITEMDRSGFEKAIGLLRPRHLRTSSNVSFLTSVEIGATGPSLILKSSKEAHLKWMYMVLAGTGQEEAANLFLQALDDLFSTETVRCAGPKSSELQLASSPKNVPQAIWSMVRDHPGRYLMCCRYCHKTTFANMLGGETIFCSPSCRSAYSKEHRGDSR